MRFLLLLPLLCLACSSGDEEEELRARLARASAERERLESELLGLRERIVELQEKLERAERRPPRPPVGPAALPGAPAVAHVEAVVTGVDEDLNIVLISAGTDDRVGVGYAFRVFRRKRFIGTLIIDRVGPDWAAGHVGQGAPGPFPERGDDVTTKN